MLKEKLRCVWLIITANFLMVTHSTEWDADEIMVSNDGHVTHVDVKGNN